MTRDEQLCNKRMPIRLKGKLCNIVVRPAMMYRK